MSGGGGRSSNVNAVFYAESYHPIQAGSIDGTDILPHDNAVYRALLCSSAGLYDPFGDPKVIGDPYCTLFVGQLSCLTDEETLRKAMSRYGRVKNLRLVRHIVTGASRGYAFIEYETEKEMRRAYEEAHHSFIDDSEIIVDFNRQQLMPGGGLGGKKESGQLRFGGRERPFRAPLRPIPYDELKRLGIPPPPEGRYMMRYQIPSPPRRKRSHSPPDREQSVQQRRRSASEKDESHSRRRRSLSNREQSPHGRWRSSKDRKGPSARQTSPPERELSLDREDPQHSRRRRRSSVDKEEKRSRRRSSLSDRELSPHRSPAEREGSMARWKDSPSDDEERHHKHRSRHHGECSHRHKRKERD
ncbi:hypothetical protein QJS10_CPB04g01854 [Acorus calamus]|uniref:RRM domain-containing protein n=1 Tax=Acorus calamus TaxID=4465 RepID=A0AAV9F1S0_ACOCL|nr:hypothetical protein QJS10_CPB04g01854 [Acorus calamus]